MTSGIMHIFTPKPPECAKYFWRLRGGPSLPSARPRIPGCNTAAVSTLHLWQHLSNLPPIWREEKPHCSHSNILLPQSTNYRQHRDKQQPEKGSEALQSASSVLKAKLGKSSRISHRHKQQSLPRTQPCRRKGQALSSENATVQITLLPPTGQRG